MGGADYNPNDEELPTDVGVAPKMEEVNERHYFLPSHGLVFALPIFSHLLQFSAHSRRSWTILPCALS